MTDYRCPSCDGGFPTEDADDGCPWCGEALDGGNGKRRPATVTPLVTETYAVKPPNSRLSSGGSVTDGAEELDVSVGDRL